MQKMLNNIMGRNRMRTTPQTTPQKRNNSRTNTDNFHSLEHRGRIHNHEAIEQLLLTSILLL